MKNFNFDRSFRHLGSLILFAAIVLVQSCSKSSSSYNNGSMTTSPPPNQVFIQNMAFNPGVISVAANTTIMWTNKDGVTHTVTSNTGKFDSGNIAPGGTFSFKFADAGSYPYHCTIHPNMTGTVNVQ